MQGFVSAGLTECDGHGRSWDVQRLGQHLTGGAACTAVFRGLIHADSKASTLCRKRPALDARTARFRLDLHRDTDPVGGGAPKNGHCRLWQAWLQRRRLRRPAESGRRTNTRAGRASRRTISMPRTAVSTTAGSNWFNIPNNEAIMRLPTPATQTNLVTPAPLGNVIHDGPTGIRVKKAALVQIFPCPLRRTPRPLREVLRLVQTVPSINTRSPFVRRGCVVAAGPTGFADQYNTVGNA